MSDHEHIDTLKAAGDPQRVAVALGLQGRGGRFRCPLCIPSGGKAPDFSLAVGNKGFICHRCGEKGDVLKLVEVALKVEFTDAIKWLENETGIPSPVRRGKGPKGDKEIGRAHV